MDGLVVAARVGPGGPAVGDDRVLREVAEEGRPGLALAVAPHAHGRAAAEQVERTGALHLREVEVGEAEAGGHDDGPGDRDRLADATFSTSSAP